MSPRAWFWTIAIVLLGTVGGLAVLWPPILWSLVLIGPVFLLGVADQLQTRHAIKRNFPVIGHGRYLMEKIRPEINQYFIESETSGRPFNREYRSVMYQRAKDVRDTVPFGTIHDVYEPGYEWMEHSLAASEFHGEPPRIRVGLPGTAKPYDASLLNISAMSFGSLSHAATTALNQGAAKGGFAHNTGEGGISPYHLQGGDLIFQVGTGYFGARDKDGRFSPEVFAENAQRESVKMIEIKLSQGAKPGHGGILPGAKVTAEIAQIRNVRIGETVISPPTHSAFEGPKGLLEFVARTRELSGGKPVGFKLCVGSRKEFLSICKAMIDTGIRPDFIAVDGGEGGTGAAPVEFTNRLGMPMLEGLAFVHSALIGCGLRDDLKLFASSKITTGFHMARALAVGADVCYSARGMMFALGCIQARLCNTNHCPVGVATHIPGLVRGLVIPDKAERVYHFHRSTVHAFMELIHAAGIHHPDELRPFHVHRRITRTETRSYEDLFHYLRPGDLLGECPPEFAADWERATADAF